MSRLWHFSLSTSELVAFTPWGGIVIADGAYDPFHHAPWSGVQVFARIRGAKYGQPKWEQIYRSVFKYEPTARYAWRPNSEYIGRKSWRLPA